MKFFEPKVRYGQAGVCMGIGDEGVVFVRTCASRRRIKGRKVDMKPFSRRFSPFLMI